MATSFVCAEEDALNMTTKADLEIFYEKSDNVGEATDDDIFKSNQLYLTFEGKGKSGHAAKLQLDCADKRVVNFCDQII